MKKSKKLSLQSLALVLMSFVLVAGVAFGMTGAWFTDNSTSNDTVALGNKIDVVLTGAFASDDVVYPGSTVKFSGTIAAGKNSSEFRMRMTAKIEKKNGEEYVAVETTKVTVSAVKVGSETVTANGTAVYLTPTLQGGDQALSYSADVTIVGETNKNEDANTVYRVTIVVEAIQAANTKVNDTKNGWVTTGETPSPITIAAFETVTDNIMQA